MYSYADPICFFYFVQPSLWKEAVFPEKACLFSGRETVIGGKGVNFKSTAAQMSSEAQGSANVGRGVSLLYFWLGSPPSIDSLQEL